MDWWKVYLGVSKFTNEGSVLRKNKKRNKIREERMDWEIRKGWQENEKKIR